MRKKSKKVLEFERLSDERAKYKIRCKCGHSVLIYPFERVDKKLCKNCGVYVFKDKKAEFEFRIQEKLRRQK